MERAVTPPEGCSAVFLPDPKRLALLDEDDLLDAMSEYEKVMAQAAAMSAQAAGLLAGRRRALALDELGPDASRTVRERAIGEAEAAVVDEIRLATGLGLCDAVGRVQLGSSSVTRAGVVRAALAAGTCTWAMARAWTDRTAELPPAMAAEIATGALRPTRDGAVLSYATFRSRLDRLVAEHVPATEQRDFDLGRRDAFGTVTPHGTGEFLVSGSAERVTAAAGRIDAIARAVRRRGDARTLGQLRSDVSLDLLIHGDIPGLAAPVSAANAGLAMADRVEGDAHAPAGQAANAASSGAMTGRADNAGAGRAANAAWSGAMTGRADDAAAGQAANAASSGSRNQCADAGCEHPVARSASPGQGDSSEHGGSPGPGGATGAMPPAGCVRAPVPPGSGVPHGSGGSGGLPDWLIYLPGGLPPAVLRVVISAASLLGLTDEPGTLADGECLPAHVVRDLAFAAGSTWRRLVTDPVSGEAIELSSASYVPPPRLREAIQVRDGTCRAPGSSVPAERCDLDHDVDWAKGGVTCAANLSAKSRRPHGHKTRGQWSTVQHPDGSIVWTTGTGRQYTTYPFQYDQGAPGRAAARPAESGFDLSQEKFGLRPAGAGTSAGPGAGARASASDGAATISGEAATAAGPGTVTRSAAPDVMHATDVTVAKSTGGKATGPGLPIDYRAKGSTPTTRPAPRRRGQGQVQGGRRRAAALSGLDAATAATRPDPGPPPF